MAIYHLNVKTGSRGGGQSAVAKADYIEREGKYEKDRDELEYSESGNMPGWAADDPRAYWSAADEHERANGRLFVQVEFALPADLNERQQRDLARSFAADLTGQERLPYTMALHRGGGENPHVHLMISERGLDGHDRNAEQWFRRANTQEPQKGGARKTSSLTGKQWLADTRERWKTAANRALERAGSAARIDHRSLAAQRAEAIERGQVERAAELSRKPGVHLGPERHRAQRGGQSRVVEIAEWIERSNRADRAERAEASAQVDRAIGGLRDREAMVGRLDRAVRRREAWARIRAKTAGVMKATAKWISAIPERRQERRIQAEREAEWATRRERDTREGAERMAKWERERKAWEQPHAPMRTPESTRYEWQPKRTQETAREPEVGSPEWLAELERTRAQAEAERRAAFIRSIDHRVDLVTQREWRRQSGNWEDRHPQEAAELKSAARAAERADRPQPDTQRGPDRDSGPSL